VQRHLKKMVSFTKATNVGTGLLCKDVGLSEFKGNVGYLSRMST
jgi:hypothetical protein